MLVWTLLLCALPQDPSGASAPQPPPPDSIWDRLSIYANGRIRMESTFDQPNGEDRHRGRMRFRLGANYDVTEDVRAEARLSTASDGGDANNPHWDFGDGAEGFNGADLVLDRFYLNWTARSSLDLRAGKFPHAFSKPPVFGELVWDDDVHPSGVAAVFAPDGGAYDLRAVEYVAVELGDDSDPSMFGVQGNVYFDTTADSRLQLSGSYSSWSSLGPGAGVLSNQGNTDVTGDFGVLEAFAGWTLEGGPLGKTQAFAQYLYNEQDDTGEDTGYAFGAKCGPSGHERDLNVFATWYDLDANAVFSPPAQDDTPIPGTGVGTGMQGVIAGFQYFIADNLSVKLWGLTSDADAAEDPYRVRLDFDFTVK